MTIGNKSKRGEVPVVGKTYWWFSIGKNAVMSRYFDGGWRAFEFVVTKPYPKDRDLSEAVSYRIRIAFAFWLPFYLI